MSLMVQETYGVGEVGWLLGLSREEAVECDTPGAQGFDAVSSSEGPPLPTIAQWVDVHRAAAQVRAVRFQASQERDEVDAATAAGMHSQGFTAREIGEAIQRAHTTAMRHARSFVEDVVAELNAPC